MRKFVVQSKKGEVTIYEVEVELVPSVGEPGLKPGEWKARILKPTSFHMKVERIVDGKKEVAMVPDVWCWHAFYEDQGEALTYANKLIEQEFAFNLRKYGTVYTDVELAAAFLAVKLEKLKA